MPQSTNIPDLDADIPLDDKHLVQGRVRNIIYNFFFRKLLVGDRGPRNAIIVYFFHKFYQECVKEFGENPVWDEDNETRIMAILARLNFNDQRVAANKVKKTKGQL